jgi:hypothetical protein
MQETTKINEKCEMRIMDPESGDLKMEWDSTDAKQVAAAEEAFKKALKDNMLFYRMNKGGTKGERLYVFDPYAERIVGMPMVAGG